MPNPPSRVLFPRFSPDQRGVWIAAVLAAAVLSLAAAGTLLFLRNGRPPAYVDALLSEEPGFTSVAYSHDEGHLVAGSAAGKIIAFNVDSRIQHTLNKTGTQPILAVAVSTDETLFAGGVERVLFGALLKGGEIQPGPDLPGFPSAITTVATHPRRAEFAVGLSNGSLYVFRRSQRPKVDSEHAGGVRKAAYHPERNLLVSGGTEGRIVWRDAEQFRLVEKTEAHASEIGGLGFSPDGRWLATGDWNGDVKVWDAESREMEFSFTQPDAVSAVCWVETTLVTGSWDGRLRLWNPERQELLAEIDTGGPIHDLAVSPRRGVAATVSTHGRVELWRLPLPR